MGRIWSVLAAAGLASSGFAKEGRLPRPESEIKAVARYSPPKGWAVSEDRLGADPVVAFSHPPEAIRIQLLGGKGSRHSAPEDFLASREAKDEGGRPAKAERKARVSGLTIQVYSRRYKFGFSDPHGGGPSGEEAVFEEFCLLPAGKRFLVLSRTVSGPAEGASAGKEWAAFLAGFSLVRP